MFKLNGIRIVETSDVSPAEAMRVLRVLCERHSENPPIELAKPSEQEDAGELKTSTLCVLPILGCLVAGEQYVGDLAELSPVSDKQREFLEMYEDLLSDIPTIKELESKADKDVDVINGWLKEKGFDIELPKVDDGFAVASVLDILLEWLHSGDRTAIATLNKEYTGAYIKNGVTVSQLLAVHPHPVVRIACKNGDTVCMSMVDSVPEGISGLFLKVADLEKVKATSHTFEGVQFPMIDLDEKPDISWINGLEFGDGFFVGSALQQTKFRMNEFGARVQSSAGMVAMRSMIRSKLPHVIDRPFLLWIRRDGFDFPIFAGLMCEDVWKEPKDL
jgi:hypothetical protein